MNTKHKLLTYHPIIIHTFSQAEMGFHSLEDLKLHQNVLSIATYAVCDHANHQYGGGPHYFQRSYLSYVYKKQ